MTTACVEVGGSGVETLLFADDGSHRRSAGALVDTADRVLVAVPGIVDGVRVIGASNLGWYDVEPLRALGIERTADLVLNDAEAAALGEVALRHASGVHSGVYVGLGTGVGGAVVIDDHVVGENLFGHHRPFSTVTCRCSEVGCLETVAAGWALPDPLTADHLRLLAAATAEAIRVEATATPELVVVAGGLARRYPQIVAAIASQLPDRRVEASAAPPNVKSASAWGLLLADGIDVRVADAV